MGVVFVLAATFRSGSIKTYPPLAITCINRTLRQRASFLSITAPTMTNVAPYPYSSTIQYPLDALLDLGGKIVEDLWAYRVSLRNAARASGDTAKEDAEDDELNDIWVALPQIDMTTYQERLADPDYVRGD